MIFIALGLLILFFGILCGRVLFEDKDNIERKL
jgi:hypothetical protein